MTNQELHEQKRPQLGTSASATFRVQETMQSEASNAIQTNQSKIDEIEKLLASIP